MGACDFNRAIVRAPPRSVSGGLRAVDRGAPSYEGVVREHAAYVRAFADAGVEVETLPALEAHPDSLFVEDAALVFADAAIVLRPGAPTRRDEAEAIAPVLRRRFERVLALAEGTVDGGDVLTTGERVLIGKSARTSAEGAAALSALLAQIGKRGDIVETPPGVLHFKSDCGMLDDETVLATARLAASGALEGLRVVLAPPGEESAANIVRVNDRVLIAAGHPRSVELLARLGYKLVELPTDEIAKIDAGLSCLSLRWRG